MDSTKKQKVDEPSLQELAPPGTDVNYILENYHQCGMGSGLRKKVLSPGQGPFVPRGCTLRVEFVALFLDGTEVDSSLSRGEAVQFVQGKGQVIRGLDEGVVTMCRKEKAEFICMPNYAYGNEGVPAKIPPNSVIKLIVKLLEWDPDDFSRKKDGGIIRHLLESGTGTLTPKNGSTVDVTVVGEVNDEEFCNLRMQFCLGEGIASSIPTGLEKAIKKMTMGEKSRIHLKSEYGFGPEGSEFWSVPPNSNLMYTVTLHEFDVCTGWWDLSSSEKLERGRSLKEKGTEYFSKNLLHLAIKLWNKLVRILYIPEGQEKVEHKDFVGEENDERKALLLSGFLNLSLAWLKLENFVNAKDAACDALRLDGNNVKALFRRGKAWIGFNEPMKAIGDFSRVLELEPNNKAAAQQITICKQRAREITATEKKIYAHMFDKFAQKDREKEEEKARKEEDVLAKVGEWGISERGHQPTDFERENPNILMLDKDGDFKDM